MGRYWPQIVSVIPLLVLTPLSLLDKVVRFHFVSHKIFHFDDFFKYIAYSTVSSIVAHYITLLAHFFTNSYHNINSVVNKSKSYTGKWSNKWQQKRYWLWVLQQRSIYSPTAWMMEPQTIIYQTLTVPQRRVRHCTFVHMMANQTARSYTTANLKLQTIRFESPHNNVLERLLRRFPLLFFTFL